MLPACRQAGFVTIDIQDKLRLFWDENYILQKGGHPPEAGRHLPPVHKINQIGKMIDFWWNEIPNHFKNIEIDEYMIMPDHFHGIIVINFSVGADRCVRPMENNNIRPMEIKNNPQLGDIVQWFKTMTTNEYIKNVKSNNWPPFRKRLWQRNFYERIIRDKEELNRIREYIKNAEFNFLSEHLE